MPYFCYIAKYKIELLYEDCNQEIVISEKKTNIREYDLNTDATVGFNLGKIFQGFTGKLAFGKKGIVQTERNLKDSYVQKLYNVIDNIKKTEEVYSLQQSLEDGDLRGRLYYVYEGDFLIQRPYSVNPQVTDVITVESKFSIGEKQYVLQLDCSVKNFSDLNQKGEYEIHSSNYRFFKKEISVRFNTIFMFLYYDSYRIIGSPLYLALFDDNLLL